MVDPSSGHHDFDNGGTYFALVTVTSFYRSTAKHDSIIVTQHNNRQGKKCNVRASRACFVPRRLLDHDESQKKAILPRARLSFSERYGRVRPTTTRLLHRPPPSPPAAAFPPLYLLAILIEPMLTMFADILRLTHHLLRKLFYKQIIATAGSLPP